MGLVYGSSHPKWFISGCFGVCYWYRREEEGGWMLRIYFFVILLVKLRLCIVLRIGLL